MRGATTIQSRRWRGQAFQSTLPVRGATLSSPRHQEPLLISIHAPRAGSDSHIFSPHFGQSIFQSTLPVRGATRESMAGNIRYTPFQSTLPVRGATERRGVIIPPIFLFQSTLPVRGATRARPPIRAYAEQFQSTLPVRGATVKTRIIIRIFK